MAERSASMLEGPQKAAEFSDASNLTSTQFLIWMGQRLDSESPLYNMVMAFTIHGEIQPVAFQNAFARLVDSSDAMRTVVHLVDNVPRCHVQPSLPYALELVDCSQQIDPDAALRAWLDRRKAFRFDLGVRSFDAALVKLAVDRWVWYLNKHHLITDGWSMGVVYKRMEALYRATLDNRAPSEIRSPSYFAYADYERSYRDSAAFKKAREYWKRRLAMPRDHIDFYGSGPPARRATRTERVEFDLGLERSKRLRALSAEPGIRTMSEDLSLFNLFCSVLFAYIARCSSARDVAILAPAHNRSSQAFKDTIGLFIEILPIQVSVDESETLQTLFDNVSQQSRAFLLNAHPGTSRLIKNGSHSVLFNFVNSKFGSFHGHRMTSEWIHPGHADGHHSLRLHVHDFDDTGSFVLHFDMNHEVFNEERRRWVVRHFVQILDAFIEDRNQPISRIELLSPEEKREHLFRFNATDQESPTGTVVRAFEAQVARTPNAVALSYEGREVSYAELNARANRLGLRLRRSGVEPQTRVGICMRRSPDLLVAILGVLKAGGAYVPIDPECPVARIAWMLDDCGARLVVTQGSELSHLPRGNFEYVELGAFPAHLGGEHVADLPAAAGPNDLAYVIYTSGSTGNPKGVKIPHRALVNYVSWARNQYLKGQVLNFALCSSVTFDLTVTSIYVPLISGGRLVIYRESDYGESEILRALEDSTVDVIKLTPSHLSLIRNTQIHNTRLKTLIVGGEDLKTELARAIVESFAERVKLYNEYGPSEATVGCMVHEFLPEKDNLPSVPIGRPAANTRIYLLNQSLHPVPLGVVGEICVAGRGVALGYLNRPELSAERFVENPWRLGEILYRTGDLARWRALGDLEFLGRADTQVKVRGARVELGEVEAALAGHPDVGACVVAVLQAEVEPASTPEAVCDRCGQSSIPLEAHRDCGPDGRTARWLNHIDNRLAAYYVSANDALAAAELRRFLSERLPSYMIPSYFVRLERLPLSVHAKIDRNALPDPRQIPSDATVARVEPRTRLEKQLATIWKDILGVRHIGVHDNFIELGGDSILNIQLVARARNAGLRITPRQVFDHPTIAGLAKVARATTSGSDRRLVTGTVPLTPIQHWFFELPLEEPQYWHQAVTLRTPERLEAARLEKAVEHVGRHHDMLRARFRRAAGGWEQTLTASSRVAVARHNEARPETVHAAMDLEAGPLMRVELVEGEQDAGDCLRVVIHHLVVDSLSWSIILEDLETVYRQLGSDGQVSLPAKSTAYKEWSQKLVTYARSAAMRRELDFWLQSESHALPPLPVDGEGDQSHATTRTVSVSLGAEETAALLRDVAPVYNTNVEDALLTALVSAFKRWTGNDHLRLHLEAHGREEILDGVDLSRTVGWFTSLYPVTLTAAVGGARHALKSIKEQLRAVPQRGIGYGLLRYLSDDAAVVRQLEAEATPEVLFNYLGRVDRAISEDSTFELSEPLVLARSPRDPRTHAFEIAAFVHRGQLRTDWTFGARVHRRATVTAVAADFIATLRDLIRQVSSAPGEFTPSDFPEASLSQQQLDDIMNDFAE